MPARNVMQKRKSPHDSIPPVQAQAQPQAPKHAAPLPYETPDVSVFKPKPDQYGGISGNYSETVCSYLGEKLPELVAPDLFVNWTFAQYYYEGENPSLELLTQTYPAGVLDDYSDDEIARMLHDVGPDIDIKRDFGYGKANTRAAENGPLGGLPAFCRVGGFVSTSNTTRTFFEAWLPVQGSTDAPFIPANKTDFPTNSTPIYLGSSNDVVQAPSNMYQLDWFAPKPNVAFDSSSDPDASLPPKSPALTKRRELSKRHDPGEDVPGTAIPGEELLGAGDGWNGRIFYVGNAGQRGFVPLPDLKRAVSRYRFVALGSNAGHFGTSTTVDWVVGDDREEKIRDWIGGRSHSTVLAVGRRIVDLYYGPQSGVRTGKDGSVRAYVAGCSVGGAAALNTVLNYPDSFDGALVGCPAVSFTALNYAQLQLLGLHRRQSEGDGFIPNQLLQGPVRQSVLTHCDSLDGVVDGVISVPEVCKPSFDEIRCKDNEAPDPAANATCITTAQIETMHSIYKPKTLGGKRVYPGFWPGIEVSGDVLTSTDRKPIEWLLMGLKGQDKVTEAESGRAFDDLFSISDLEAWQKEDIGSSDVSKTNLAPFFKNGGKLLHYHGLSDLRASSHASRAYYEGVKGDKANKGIELDSSYRYFEVPGMKHCRDGPGPWQFGGVAQNAAGNRPLRYDSEADVLLALIAWTERGVAPVFLIGASYTARSITLPTNSTDPDHDLTPTEFRSFDYGVDFTRKLCPYPKRSVAAGIDRSPTAYNGDKAYLNFVCDMISLPNSAEGPASPASVWLLLLQIGLVVAIAFVLM